MNNNITSNLYKLSYEPKRSAIRSLLKKQAASPMPMPGVGPIAQINAMGYGINPQMLLNNPGMAAGILPFGMAKATNNKKAAPSVKGTCQRIAQAHRVKDPNEETGEGANVLSMNNKRNFLNPSNPYGPGRGGTVF